MHAFAEWTWRLTGIVRVGPTAEIYGDEFDYAVAVVVPWRSVVLWLMGRRPVPAIVKALVAPKVKPITLSHARAVISALQKIGLTATWERARNINSNN